MWLYRWFARDVMTSLLADGNNEIFLVGELTAIFTQTETMSANFLFFNQAWQPDQSAYVSKKIQRADMHDTSRPRRHVGRLDVFFFGTEFAIFGTEEQEKSWLIRLDRGRLV